MAAGTRGELCDVCKERFDEENHDPVALTCGDSFCRPCVLHLHNTRPPLRCPNCRKIHEGCHPQDLPKNFLLLNIIGNIPEDAEARLLDEEITSVKQNKNESYKESDSSSNSSSDSSDTGSEKEKKRVKNQKYSKRKEKKKSKEESNKEKGSKENVPEPEEKNENVINMDLVESKLKFAFHPESTKGKAIVWLIILIFAVFGGILAYKIIAPSILRSVGFGSKGIVKGTYAASIQSQRDKALLKEEEISDDYITQNFKWFQKVGMNGFDPWIDFGIFVAGFVVFFLIGVAIASCHAYHRHHKAVKLATQDQRIPLSQASPKMISVTIT